jgi:hypothetical protein
MDASKLKEAVGDRYRAALARIVLLLVVLAPVLVRVCACGLVLELGFRMAWVAGCMQISD